VPAYWERLDPTLSVLENVRELVLSPSSYMQEEPLWLLQDFITDPYNYVGIMQAIARGDRTSARICSRTGLPKGHVSRYLSILRDTGFVERRIPVTEPANSRRSRYYVTDPYLRFYYHFLSAQKTQLAIGGQRQALSNIEHQLPEFVEQNTWQELCSEWLLRSSAHQELPFSVTDVGSAWTRTAGVDVAGINRDSRHLVLGTCLWRGEPGDVAALQEMVARTAAIVPEKGKWSVAYLGFSADGWTPAARRFAAGLSESGASGANWKPVYSRLLDLEEVDDDLVRLSAAHLH
jgi:uncharacterized protein